MVFNGNLDSVKTKKEVKRSKLRSKSAGLKKYAIVNENSDKPLKRNIFGPKMSDGKNNGRPQKSCMNILEDKRHSTLNEDTDKIPKGSMFGPRMNSVKNNGPEKSRMNIFEEKRHVVSKYTALESTAIIVKDNIGTSASRRVLPNTTFRKSNTYFMNKIIDTKVGDNKDKPQKSGINQAIGRKLNNVIETPVCKQKIRKVSVLPIQTILPEVRKKVTEVDIQTSCLIETFAKSCQTLRQSQMDILNIKTMFHTLLDKIKSNKWGYEFTYVIFQTAAETSNMKSLKINKTKKPSMMIASVMNQIQHFDELFKFDDSNFSKYETKELIEVVTWLLNDTKFSIKGTVNAEEVAEIMFRIEETRRDFLPAALFHVTYSPESHILLEWSSIRNKTDRVIQCFMFISPTKIYKYLRHGLSRKASKQYVAFQNHLPFLEEETENFLIWDIWRTREEDELIIVAVVDMVDDEKYYEESIFQDQIIYKVKDPASLIIKHILLYSRNQYQVYKENDMKIQKRHFSIYSFDFTFWLALFFTFSLTMLLAYEFALSRTEQEVKENEFSILKMLIDAILIQV